MLRKKREQLRESRNTRREGKRHEVRVDAPVHRKTIKAGCFYGKTVLGGKK